jgi:hypothetical protein
LAGAQSMTVGAHHLALFDLQNQAVERNSAIPYLKLFFPSNVVKIHDAGRVLHAAIGARSRLQLID